ncbi:MAG: glycosyltransferase [Sedimentisphaerales bacterium]|nr:glycosyltransferase [Sedimentisphaerales bacterium]
MDEQKHLDVICFGGEDWWYKNRGHIDMQLMRRFARMGTTLYVNSIVMQKPTLKKNTAGGKSFSHKLIRKMKSILRGLQESGAGFWVYSPFSLPAHHISWARPLNEMILRRQIRHIERKLNMDHPLIWIACPAACDTALRIKESYLVYQRTDRFEEYPNVDEAVIKEYDRKLKTSADLTVFVNKTLYDQEASQCKKAIYLDHGVDFEFFADAEKDPSIPEEMAEIPKPIVGFFGAIDDHTMDVPFVEKTISLLPEMSFVFIGDASSDVTDLASHKNVWLLGRKNYGQISHYGKCFDVAIMPWRQNDWIKGCNPIKLKEYLALGKPTVSTPFPELDKYLDVVYQAKTPEAFAEAIQKGLVEDNDERIAARRKKIQKATWDSKAALVLERLFEDEEPSEEELPNTANRTVGCR